MTCRQINTGLLPRPWSCHEPRIPGFEPLIVGRIERVKRIKRNGWVASVSVDGSTMYHSHHDTKAMAESRLESMLDAYTAAHYISR